jgi:DNA-binding transcriptional ArsR family regulator
VLDIQVIDDPAAAAVALGPMRSRLLSELVVPASAATLATRVGIARQKVNYHLHALEAHGLVQLAEERKWGGLTERLLVATAATYVVSPGAMGPVAADPNREIDRLSASYLIALGARVVREVGDLFVVRMKRANAWRPWRWIPKFASGRRRTARLSAPNSPTPSPNWLRSTTMNPRPAAARIAW